ncbi:SpoIIE family protein phosphatase [Dactylosporangium sp. NPDC051485]|uniref:SpoIIE family protein phosphatase n=1 Tax=Dactylosporangium sp. NPDC051485 TaxID=3154846 RepID=UPI003437AD74
MDADPIRSAVEQAPYILIACEGPELTVAGLNGASRALFEGLDVLGRPLGEALADLAGQQWIDLYRQVYRTGEPVTGERWRAHLTLPDGSVREIFADFSITPWRHPDGRIRGVIGGGVDVTGLVQAQLSAERHAADMQQQYRRARDVVDALQQALLPRGLPLLPGVRVAASYLLAGAGAAAGGDWFDAVPRPGGSVGLVVGDVVGHGVTASGVMGQLRAVLQDRLDDGARPAAAVSAADRLARRVPSARAATACVAVLDVTTGELAYCTAGHPPPLVVSATGEARYLPASGGAPLGTGGAFPVATARLAPGDVLLLYSDGIIERPGRTAEEAAAELARVAADAVAGRALHAPGASPAERACTQIVELLVRASGYRDDITLLAAQLAAPPEPLRADVPPDLTRLGALRKTFGAWLEALGVTDEDAFALQHAVGELVTNAVEHSAAGEQVGVVARLTDTGVAEVTVTGRGAWREPRRVSPRGRGLALSSQLVDDLSLDRSGDGTVATLHHRLTRPAALLGRSAPESRPCPQPAADPELSIMDDAGHPGRVVLAGPIDGGSVDRVQHELLYRSRGGTLPLTVDLAGVTYLASAGVAVLHALAARHRAHGTDLVLAAPPGSPARHVLALVALPCS